MSRHLSILIKGFLMGAADVVPGVSGGTMAFILGIYQRLLEAIRAFDARLLGLLWRRELAAAARHTDLAFLLFLLTGIGCALLFFTRVVPLPVLIHTRPELVYGLFFGLVLASIRVLLAEVDDLRPTDLVALGVGAALGLAVVNLVPTQTPETPAFVFASGALAICAMILPGISGSFILLILRKYVYIFDALGHLDLAVILPFALGAITGLMLFSRLLVWLLHHWYRITLLVITGILLGSLWMLWPFQERVYETVRGKARLLHATPLWPSELDARVWASLGLLVAGVVVVEVIHRLARSRPTPA